jgi:hypothetical protein
MSVRAKYTLEIYHPNSSDRDVMVVYESDYPFPSMHTGQIIRPLGTNTDFPGAVMMIRHVEHIIWMYDDLPRYKMCIFTMPVSDHPHDGDDALKEIG